MTTYYGRESTRNVFTPYKRGEISQEKAAQVAGLDRTDILLAMAREGEDAFVVDFADLGLTNRSARIGNPSI